MERYIRKLYKIMKYNELEYGYGEFTFRIGTHTISESEITDSKVQKVLTKLRKCLKNLNVSEMLIGGDM